jgi:hypothetical protein
MKEIGYVHHPIDQQGEELGCNKSRGYRVGRRFSILLLVSRENVGLILSSEFTTIRNRERRRRGHRKADEQLKFSAAALSPLFSPFRQSISLLASR